MILKKRNKEKNKEINNLEFKKRKLKLTTYPNSLFVELTRNCNCCCIMCARSMYKTFQKYDKKYNMPFNAFKLIADTLFPYAEKVDLRGFGESLIHPKIIEMISYTEKFNIRKKITTNLNIKNKKVIKKLIDSDFTTTISFDAHQKGLYEKIRVGANFNRITENIKYLTSNIPKENINNIKTNTTIQPANMGNLLDIIKLLHKLGIKNVYFCPDGRYHLIEKHLNVICKEMEKVVLFAKKNNIKLRQYIIPIVKKSSEIKNKFCDRPWKQVYITYNGLVGPCDHHMEPPLYFGDLAKNKFEDIWNNESFVLFRKKMIENKSDTCKWCFENPYHLE